VADDQHDDQAGHPTGHVTGDDSEDRHDDTGLDLARTLARSMAGSRRRGRKRRQRNRGEAQLSGSHPDDRDPQTLDQSISRLVAEQGWSAEVRVHGVFTRWDSIVGREVAQHVAPEAFSDGRLRVRTDSTAWATQFRLLAPTVLARLNEELGDGTVTFVEVVGPVGPSWKKGRRSVRDGRGPRDTYG
jgi:predicted nucleic acid-binding Zn ribbon protein